MTCLTTEVPACPAPILHAYTAIFRHSFFKGLTSKGREILGEIVIRLDQRDALKPIWFKRTNVADKLGCDRKTIYHTLNQLEQMGLIERGEQDLSAEGFFQCAPITVTARLAKMLGLPYAGASAGTKSYPQGSDASAPPRGEFSASINNDVNNLFEKQPSGSSAQPERHPKKEGLWADPALALLRAAGISAPGVYALMTLCKKHGGQRLSTIIECLRRQVDGMRSGQLFAYLSTCIRSRTDFARKYAEEAGMRAAEQAKERRRKFIKEFAGRRLVAKNGNFIDVFDGACSMYRADGMSLGATAIQAVFEAYEDGLLTAA
ncbi:hypothetical protein [Burkholderia vietnamiensis]|uniref:hypothetical protein n=1 Tax=Burkholderia vietnamiensis TaxID=60552 RepID=UPI0015935D13|nr:hypothetical protein [Burkholderia vietnamiensis]